MFGRRNPDQSSPSPETEETDINLDLLPDLSEFPASAQPPAPQKPNQPATNPMVTQPFDREWNMESIINTAPTAPPPPANLPEPIPFLPSTPSSSAAASSTGRIQVRPKSATESVIGPDDFFDGSYRSERGVRIQGSVRGSIESRQYIYVEASAQVEANLSAEDITVAGSFNGKIECRHKLEVTSTGKVYGNVQTALLVVQEGGLLDGELHMKERDQPDES